MIKLDPIETFKKLRDVSGEVVVLLKSKIR